MAARRPRPLEHADPEFDDHITAPRRRGTFSEPPADPIPDDDTPWSTYVDAAHGPEPSPTWLVTDGRAHDTDLGVLKTGKEADVSLLRRELTLDGEPHRSCLLAVKRYRSADHRMFHRDAGYLEGRKTKKSRETRAIANRTAFGKDVIAAQWAVAEFEVLSALWSAGAAVPYPVQLIGSELMMEFIGDDDGVAAPRLAETRPTVDDAHDLFGQMVDAMTALAEAGYAHGDLSAYNTLVHDGRLVLIDVPQAVDLVANPQGFTFLRRDCENICRWFAGRDVPEADPDQLYDHLIAHMPGS
jgi:RIO kinase 1